MKRASPSTNGHCAGPATGRHGRHALLVGCDRPTIATCRLGFERRGYTLEHVENGVAAVSAVREVVPDLVVVDMQLADVPGHEALRWLQSMPTLRAARFVALVSVPGERLANIVQPALQLRKPLSAAALARVLDTVAPARSARPALSAEKDA
jgi:CheY-like chemotaxis protein